MRCAEKLFAALLSIVLTTPVFGQQTATSSAQGSPQALSLVRNSLAALVGNATISDVTLTVRARHVMGSDDEAGTAVLKAQATGESRADFSFPSGVRTEVRSGSLQGGKPGGQWSGPDGTPHAMAEHNLKLEGAWFCPALLLHSVALKPDKALFYLGNETLENQRVEHVRVADDKVAIPDKAPPTVAQLIQHLTEVDFYLDSATFLVAKVAFNEHPDNDASKDIPVEIHFSDYRPVSGVQMPFHFQKLFNGTLVLDIQVDSIVLNSGLLPSTFSLQ